MSASRRCLTARLPTRSLRSSKTTKRSHCHRVNGSSCRFTCHVCVCVWGLLRCILICFSLLQWVPLEGAISLGKARYSFSKMDLRGSGYRLHPMRLKISAKTLQAASFSGVGSQSIPCNSHYCSLQIAAGCPSVPVCDQDHLKE